MNNDQFRRLVLDKPGKKTSNIDNDNAPESGSQNQSSPPSAAGILGSRMRASIPMTPRSLKGSAGNNNDFARQLAEHRREEAGQQPPAKRFKSSAAPKGSRLASGYQDRTALRRQQEKDEEEQERQREAAKKEDVERRIKALEDMRNLRQIDQGTFEKLRREILDEDSKDKNMAKGLNWDLLRRAKAGEDISEKPEGEEEGEEQENEESQDTGDVDEELDRVLEEKDEQFAVPAPKEKKVKKGNLAPAPPGKLSRDEILKQLKASRAAGSASMHSPEPTPESILGNKFKKIDKSEKKRWVETDPNGRRKEILVVTDAEGRTKRKVRWLDKEVLSKVDNNGLLVPDQDMKPIGMEVPAVVAARIAAEKAAEAEAEDDDIFAGVGTDYNPLGDLDEDDSEEDEEKEGLAESERLAEEEDDSEPSVQPVAQQQARRNYFKDSKAEMDTGGDEARTSNPLTSDPTLLAALKRAATLRQSSTAQPKDDGLEEGEYADDVDDPEKLARRKKFLEEARRRDAQDAQDLDLGFGSSRIEDEEDEEGPTFDDGDQKRGSNKRKRGPKKRKGDKDSAADVLRVMEGRKKQ